MRRWASCQQYVLVRFLSARKRAGEAAPRGTVQLKDQVDGIYDAKATTSRGQSSRSNEVQVCLQQWAEFESRWNRLAPSCVIERIPTQARSLNATCFKRPGWGRCAGAGLPVRFKHTRADVLTEQEKSSVNLNETGSIMNYRLR